MPETLRPGGNKFVRALVREARKLQKARFASKIRHDDPRLGRLLRSLDASAKNIA